MIASRPSGWIARLALVGMLGLLAAAPASAQMDLSQAAGVPLPAADLPAGTVSVRVVRESFANNLSGETVVFLVDGQEHARVVTDATGRAQVDGLPAGARVRATAVVGDETLETQDAVVGSSGVRFVLVAGLGALDAASTGPAVPGSVFLGPNSRIVLDYSNELLNVYYVVQVVNPGSAPVDIGGPLVIDLPTEARSATMMEGATPQATVSNARVTVRGPFAPGATPVNVAFTLPFGGDTALLEQQWPAPAQSFAVFALKTGEMDLVSAQLLNKQHTTQQGQPIVAGTTPALTAGEVFHLEVTGLPHRPTWPRNVVFGLAAIICAIGLWAAFGPGARFRTA